MRALAFPFGKGCIFRGGRNGLKAAAPFPNARAPFGANRRRGAASATTCSRLATLPGPPSAVPRLRNPQTLWSSSSLSPSLSVSSLPPAFHLEPCFFLGGKWHGASSGSWMTGGANSAPRRSLHIGLHPRPKSMEFAKASESKHTVQKMAMQQHV